MRSKSMVLELRPDTEMPGPGGRDPGGTPDVAIRLLRFSEVRQRTGLSRSTIWRLERRGSFPKRVEVSANVVAWREDEIATWIGSKIRRR